MTSSSIPSSLRARPMGKRPALRMRRWCAGDEDAFTPRADFAQDQVENGWDWSKGAPGPTWTILRWTGEVVGIGGVIEQRTAWHAWAQLADVGRRDWPQLVWLASRVLAFMESQHQVAAFTADARVAQRGSARLLRKLGFGFEQMTADGQYLCMVRRA